MTAENSSCYDALHPTDLIECYAIYQRKPNLVSQLNKNVFNFQPQSFRPILSFPSLGERGQVSSDQRGHQQQRAVVGCGADLHSAICWLLADETTERLPHSQEVGVT